MGSHKLLQQSFLFFYFPNPIILIEKVCKYTLVLEKYNIFRNSSLCHFITSKEQEQLHWDYVGPLGNKRLPK